MKRTFRLWAAAAAAVAVPAQAFTLRCLPSYEDCWREGLESEGAEIVAEKAKEAPWIEAAIVKAGMLQNILDVHLDPPDPEGTRALKRSGRVLADLSDTLPGPESDELLEQFPFLRMEGGSGGWGIGAQLEPGTAAARFRSLRDELFRLVERAIFASGANARAEAVALWACDTDILVITGQDEPAGIFNEEQCHRLFS